MLLHVILFSLAAFTKPLASARELGELDKTGLLPPSPAHWRDEDLLFLEQYDSQEYHEQRGSRAIDSSSSAALNAPHSAQCRGSLTHLKANEATVLKSHRGYGASPYPSDYHCRFLVIPTDCDLGIECDLGTFRNLRRSRYSKCSGADYLRVLGYKGTLDNFYCGNRGPRLSFHGDSAIALVFKSGERRSEEETQRQSSLFGLSGFSCKVVCKAREEQGADDEDRKDNDRPELTTKRPGVTTGRPSGAPSPTPTAGPLPQGTTPSGRPGSKPTPRPRCVCGESRQGRIVCPTGHNCTAGLGEIPWQAALVNRGSSQPWCGGSLINNRFVLTAAHCLASKKAARIQVILGDHDWTTKKETKEYRYGVTRIIRHPKFGSRAQYDYDFALLRLDRPVDFARVPRIRPICLPGHDEFPSDLVGRIGVASGWGVVDPSDPSRQSRKLRQVSVEVISMGRCRSKYPLNPVTDNMICAQADGADACYGDSGGPFTVRAHHRGGHRVLEGVISWGKSCAQERWPGVYARVRVALDWILTNAQEGEYCSRNSRSGRELFESGEEDETEDGVIFPE